MGAKWGIRPRRTRARSAAIRQGLVERGESPVKLFLGVGVLSLLFAVSIAGGVMLGKWTLSSHGQSNLSTAGIFPSPGAAGNEKYGSTLDYGGPLEPFEDESYLLEEIPDPLEGIEIQERSYTFTRSDNLFTSLTAMGVERPLILQWCKTARDEYDLAKVKPGQSFTLYSTPEPDREFVKFELNISSTERIVISRDREDYQVFREYVEPPRNEQTARSYINKPAPHWVDPETGLYYYQGVIDGNFYDSAVNAGMTPGKVMALIQVFGTLNFHCDVKSGDRFKVVVTPGDDRNDEGLILAAMIESRGKPRYIFRFEHGDQAGYFTETGDAARTDRLICPVRYTRISSYYTLRRYHPILHIYRPHRGVDYAAPAGRPVKAAAHGKVIQAGWKGQFGRTITIRHNRSFKTQYAHLSGYARGIRKGKWVRQGQVIGYVGSTGLSTGPHLDYRVYRNGMPINPLRVTGMPKEPVKDKKAFEKVKQRLMAEIEGEVPLGPPRPWSKGFKTTALARVDEK